ncbi:hypothetical protein ACFSOZ_32155 [Mesorhizobium newzealandense]|uniref:Uncharacterized protein n=1 Tax=Mesorhizobium newzealandense TaxID=1300302 RepID=A0ABW4ULH8_9HYPH
MSTIGQVERSAPQLGFGKVENVANGVLIGMVSGGPIDRLSLNLSVNIWPLFRQRWPRGGAATLETANL